MPASGGGGERTFDDGLRFGSDDDDSVGDGFDTDDDDGDDSWSDDGVVFTVVRMSTFLGDDCFDNDDVEADNSFSNDGVGADDSSSDDDGTVPKSLLATVGMHTVCCGGNRDGVIDDDFIVRSFDDGCVDNEGVEYVDDVVDNDGDGGKDFNDDEVDDNAFDESDDKPFDHDDCNGLLLAKAFGSWCVGLVVVDDVVDDGCANP